MTPDPAEARIYRWALDRIRYLGMDVPAAHNSAEAFYRGQLMEAIGTAARTVAAVEGGYADELLAALESTDD